MKVISQFPKMEAPTSDEDLVDQEIAALVGQEILENRLDPSAWATAVSSSGDKRQEALAAYARIRIQRLSVHHQLSREKVRSFESRRVSKCFGVKSVRDLLQRAHPERQLNFLRPKMSVMLMVILFVGSAGSIGALGRLFNGSLPALVETIVPIVAVLCGLAMVAAAMSLRFFLPKRWIMMGWNTGLLCLCSFACFSSLLGGVQLIAQATSLETTTHAAAPVTASTVTVPLSQEQVVVSVAP
ncbi:MAG: hypothetical protein ACRCXD_10805 [Luteolibacter sp.]